MPLHLSDKKYDVKTRVIRFLTDADLALTTGEEKILARWERADFLMRSGSEWNDIIMKLTHEFSISKFTAENDIASSQEVFGRSRKINKKYIVHLHLQRINKLIQFTEKKLYDANVMPDAKELAAIAKLHEVYTYTANSIPADETKKWLPPPIMLFSLPAGTKLVVPMDLNEALRQADEIIDITHTEINEDEPPGE